VDRPLLPSEQARLVEEAMQLALRSSAKQGPSVFSPLLRVSPWRMVALTAGQCVRRRRAIAVCRPSRRRVRTSTTLARVQGRL
jgi:hypothetical protein